MFMTPGESLVPGVLLLEQESYLSYKKKGHEKAIASYRPISILNIDYKIYTKILKNQMEKVLDTIIGKRNSQLLLKTEHFYALSTVRGINDVSNKLNKNFSVISSYFLKAFDRVACNFFFSALRRFEYGDKFIHMFKVAFNNMQSKIKTSGLLSDPSTLMQRLCQGCPLSMLLYIIVTEVLVNFIDVDKRIKGMQIGDHDIKTVNFTDDTIIFLRDVTYLNT